MKKITAILLCLILLLGVLAGCDFTTTQDKNALTRAQEWIELQIKENTLFSFDYDGENYSEHIRQWKKSVDKSENSWTVTYKNDGMTAWSVITLDEELAALEWTNYFKNEGSANSPAISNIMAINSSVFIDSPIFTSAYGSTASSTDFESFSVDLTKEDSYSMATHGGRSSEQAFPYFDISNGTIGVVGAIGWSGNWKADFAYEDGKVTMVAGMQKTNISLYAGEEMRTPMIVLQFFDGTQAQGHNAWRRLVLKSYTPIDDDGEPLDEAPLFAAANTYYSEDDLILQLNNIESSGRHYDGLWLDASWYGVLSGNNTIDDNVWSDTVGNWYFSPEIFQNGNMLKVSAWLEEHGKDLCVWFEPERVMSDTMVANEHPEWLLSDESDTSFYLFDFSNDEACDYMINLIGSIIKENHITWYRQDFNRRPANKWSAADSNDRVGMTEIKYITNIYRFWDSLVEMNPGLMIDNCASGGHRLDIEMMSRSIPLWRTDHSTTKGSSADSIRSINYNLTWWLPIHGGGYPWYNNGTVAYNLRCQLSAGGSMNIKFSNEANSFVAENRNCGPMMLGDYYMLSYGTGANMKKVNAAYQFNLPEESRGYVMTFRPLESNAESSTYVLQGLIPEATYELKVSESGDTMTMTGEQLMTGGLGVRYPAIGYSVLIYYSQVK